jgi:hypothetical protein
VSQALADWKAKAVSEPITLPSGTVVTLRLPTIRDCLIAGEIPLPILNKLTKAVAESQRKNGKPLDLSTEDMLHDEHFDRAMVAQSVETVNGEPVELSLDEVHKLPTKDRAEIVAYCVRMFADPKAG